MTLMQRAKRDGFDLNALYPETPLPPRAPAQSFPAGKGHSLDAPLGRLRSTPPRIDRERRRPEKSSSAWIAAKLVLATIGAASTAAFVSVLPYWILAADAGGAGLAWFAVYRVIRWKRAQ